VAYAQDKGAVIVATYGNEGLQLPDVYPADFEGVISVAATDEDDVRAPFTNYGRDVTVGAPGVRIVGPWGDRGPTVGVPWGYTGAPW
jgi:thermitase